jgi:hypothetical protein
MHFRREPVESTRDLIENAPLTKLDTGTRAVVEIISHSDGHFRLATSVVEGTPGRRTIRQHGRLNFRDADETKDALDFLIDRLARRQEGD